MKVLHVNMNLDAVHGGGTVERVWQLHRCMKQMPDVQSRILCLHSPDGHGQKDADVIEIPCLNRRWYLPAPYLLLMYRQARWADVIHLMNHWTVINALMYIMACLTHTPYVVCPAGALTLFGRSGAQKRLYRTLIGRNILRQSSAAIVIAEHERGLLYNEGVSETKIEHIPNGVNADDFRCQDVRQFRHQANLGDRDYILFVGRLNPIKGADLLLQAFASLAQDFPMVDLVLAGPDGGQRMELEQQALAAGLQSRIHFPGVVRGGEKSAAYHHALVTVIPSRKEAMSIVALEAAICASPVVLTDQCGFDHMEEAGAALLAEANSESLARRLREVLRYDCSARNTMGQRGQAFARDHYTWQWAAKRHIKMFETCISSS
jgi:glycosyltransferase involved in cell wall biosynthesis